MSDTLISRRDLDFLLWEWLQLDAILTQPEYAAHDRETVDAVLDLSAQVAEDLFLPHFKACDQDEPRIDAEGNVRVHPSIGPVLREYAGLGLFGMSFKEELGGMYLPQTAVTASQAYFMAANVAIAAYPMLTAGNARVIAAFGTPKQVDAFALPQIAGTDLGTMCLSEPQAGSGLADVRTRAEPDGADEYGERYRLSGNKMWISGGDQDITRNIIHLVLAKIPGEDGRLSDGTKAISLFIVPKWLPGDERNDVSVAGLNHKMGYRGTSNCLLNFGEGLHQPMGKAGAVGYLIGKGGDGLALMFQMMNEARIAVGLGAAAIAYRGYRQAVRYAREREQGRAVDPAKAGGPVAIINHPDVQRMLLAQKVYSEGALALVLYCSSLVDREHHDPDATELLALLTPIAKSWPSEWGVAANDLAIQVHGGYGYTRDFDVEQLYRDNRLNPIHEGTTGIQGLDLLGRKVLRSNGRAMALLGAKVADTVSRTNGNAHLAEFGESLVEAWSRLEATVDELRGAPPERALANATAFMFGFGHVVMAWLWLDQALACDPNATGEDAAYYAGKVRACRFFFECELPKTRAWLSFAASLSDVASGVPAEQF